MLERLLLASERPLIEELYEYFERTFFAFDGRSYENFSIGGGSMINVGLIIIGIFLGIVAANFFTVYNKRVLGDFVRSLIGEGCDSPENAKTLSELGYVKDTFVRSSLRSGVTLRKYVRCAEEEEYLLKYAKEHFGSDEASTDKVASAEENACGAESATDCENGENVTRVEKNAAGDAKNSENVASGTSENSVNVEKISADNADIADAVEKKEQNIEKSADKVGENSEKTAKDGETAAENGLKSGKSDALTRARLSAPAYKIDLSSDRFYISPDDRYKAEIKFEKRGASWLGLLLTTLIILVFLGIALFFMPDILQFLDNVLSFING